MFPGGVCIFSALSATSALRRRYFSTRAEARRQSLKLETVVDTPSPFVPFVQSRRDDPPQETASPKIRMNNRSWTEKSSGRWLFVLQFGLVVIYSCNLPRLARRARGSLATE